MTEDDSVVWIAKANEQVPRAIGACRRSTLAGFIEDGYEEVKGKELQNLKAKIPKLD